MALTEVPALLVLTRRGLSTARLIQGALPGSEVCGLAGRVDEAERVFTGVAAEARRLFRASRPIIGLCAAGILIRALAPMLRDKGTEPPILAVAEDGSAVVPLLGGHGGANALARQIADRLGVVPTITTATDRRFDVALDDPPPGWTLANPEHFKAFAAAMLQETSVRLEGEAAWLRASELPVSARGTLTIRVTEKASSGSEQVLIYHPAVLALGVGCERGTAEEELCTLVRETLAEGGLAPAAVAAVYSVDVKADERAVHAVAEMLGVPARFFGAERLEAETPRLAYPSDVVFREVGCHGVAEASALAAAGADGRLIVAKQRSQRATCAVAQSARVIAAGTTGRPRGSLNVVGIGPGPALWRSPESDQAVRCCTDLVAYRAYVDLLGALCEGKQVHAYRSGEEEARARAALELAGAGRRVALVSSGDPGVYAMAALVFELLEREARPDWLRIAIAVVPGISAMQAAAARVGAPLGHDFCAISLSDLLTPWSQIEERLRAAARGDFAVALYNPASSRRRWQLEAACSILREQRPASTPVVVARNVGREDEAVHVTRLEALPAERVDMLTIVLVGSSATRRISRAGGGCWVYTPRGYATHGQGNSGAAA